MSDDTAGRCDAEDPTIAAEGSRLSLMVSMHAEEVFAIRALRAGMERRHLCRQA